MQPERHIEKLLRAFARKRRDQAGAGFDLHPATRRMLQGEVARQCGRSANRRASWWQSWAGFGPRVAFATGTLAAVVVIGLLLFPPGAEEPEPTLTIVRDDSLAAVNETKAVLPPPATAPAPPAILTRPSRAQETFTTSVPATPRVRRAREDLDRPAATYGFAQNESAKDKVAPGLEPAAAVNRVASPSPSLESPTRPAASPARTARLTKAVSPEEAAVVAATTSDYAQPTGGLRLETALKTKPAMAEEQTQELARASRARGGSATRTAASPAAIPSLDDRSSSVTEDGSVGRGYFETESASPAATYARKDSLGAIAGAQSSVTSPVLASFQLEQRGSEIHIVDADGSVYVGTVQQSGEAMGFADSKSRKVPPRSSAKTKATSYGLVQSNISGPTTNALPMVNFIVRGTNATLRQGVVFAGNFHPGVLVQLDRANTQAAQPTVRFQSQATTPNRKQDSQLIGRARLANGAEIEINAIALPQAPARTP